MRVGMSEVLVILLAALILFGPSRLPEMGKALGKAIREFRHATTDLGRELEQARDDIERAAEPAPAPEDGQKGDAEASSKGSDEGKASPPPPPVEEQPR